MNIIKWILSHQYRGLLHNTKKLRSLVFQNNLKDALRVDEFIISRFNYSIDGDLWITMTQIRMELHYKAGNIVQAWQLGNNLIYMMGDESEATMSMHAEITKARDA